MKEFTVLMRRMRTPDSPEANVVDKSIVLIVRVSVQNSASMSDVLLKARTQQALADNLAGYDGRRDWIYNDYTVRTHFVGWPRFERSE